MKQLFTKYFCCFQILMLFTMCQPKNTEANKLPTETLPQQHSLQTRINKDSTAIIAAFQKLKTNKSFLKDVGLEKEKQWKWNNDLVKIILGDLDKNGVNDALVYFTIEGRNAGNNWDGHYAILLNQGNQWKYQTQLDAGGSWAQRVIKLNKISNGKITGNLVSTHDENLPEVSVEYIFENGKFINSYTALHQTEMAEREFLSIQNIITPQGKLIPLTATLKTYEKLLGKGSISTPTTAPDCGTYFDEGIYSDLDYNEQLQFELKNNKQAAWRSVILNGTSYQLQTDKGTINAHTTLNELKNIFYNQESWQLFKEADGNKTFIIPDGAASDNQLHILFNKANKIISVQVFIPC